MATSALDALPPGEIDRRQPITEQVRRPIHRAIIRGHLPPRTRLSENELSLRLGVSRTPVREALIRLAEDGLVDVYPHYGSFVAPIRLSEVYEARFIREALECAVVERAAQQSVPDLAVRLRQNLDRQSAAASRQDFERFVDLDEEFHHALSEAAGHPRVWRVVQAEKYQMDRVRFLSVPKAQSVDRLIEQHEAVASAVIDRRAEAAVAAMRTHLREIFTAINELSKTHAEFFADGAGNAPPAGSGPR